MGKTKVLHIIKSLGRGGAEMLLPETLALHDKNNFEFHYIYFLPWKNQVVDEIKQNGGYVECITATNNVKIILSARKIASYIINNNIDIIHCHLPWAGIVGRIAGRLANVPVVYTEHNKWERYHKLTFFLNKLTFGMQTVVIPCSFDVEVSIKKYYKKNKPNIQVISNGVNTDKFKRGNVYGIDIKEKLGINESSIVIGIISVFRFQKRLKEWLQAAKDIHHKNPQTYFIVVGDGPLNDELRQLANELDMDAYLHFTGLQSEVRPYLKAMDIFMMSSEFEGLPIALLEAMSMECIPVCTTAGGIPEVIKNEHNGILVDVAHPELLAEKVNNCLLDWEFNARKLSVNARETVATYFSLQQMVGKLEDLYIKFKKAD